MGYCFEVYSPCFIPLLSDLEEDFGEALFFIAMKYSIIIYIYRVISVKDWGFGVLGRSEERRVGKD